MIIGKNRSLLTILAVVVPIAAILIGSFAYLHFTPSTAADNISFGSLGTSSEFLALVHIAQSRNYFSNNGIKLTIVDFSTGGEALDAASIGNVDIASSTGFSFAASVALPQKELSIIASIDKMDAYFILGRKDRGIQNPIDLNNKRVAVVPNTAGEFYLGRFLELEGLSIRNVTLVNVPLTEAPSALVNGTVDFIVGTRPVVNQAQQLLRGDTVMWSAQSSQMAYVVLGCRNDWVAQHQELVVRFLKSLSQAEDYLINNRASAEALVSQQRNQTISSETWSDNHNSLSLDQSLIVALQDQVQWMITNKMTNATTVPSFSNYIYSNCLRSVQPDSVNIIG
jgi:ABC-type nitrate/sulfonate/bicarbonate transport system substrate-binding protein